MKHQIRKAATRSPMLANALWRLMYPAFFRRDERYSGQEYNDDRQRTFETIYSENRWLSEESRSGCGSSLDQTILLRKRLPGLLRSIRASRLLDAPCGDFNWMQTVEFDPGSTYVGGEIVPALVQTLGDRFGRPDRLFVQLDIVTDPLPSADLWLCRDVLFHLSNSDIQSVLQNFVGSDIEYLLTTTYDFVTHNSDIRSGGFRFINLQRSPFNFCKPRAYIDDFLAPEPPRQLGLWSRAEIQAALASPTTRSSG